MAARAVDSEEVLDSRGEVTRLVGVFASRKGQAGEVPAFFVHCRGTGRKELRHGGLTKRYGMRLFVGLP